jgi:integrase
VNDREPGCRHATAAGLAEKREASALPEAAKRDQAIVADPRLPSKGISDTPAELDETFVRELEARGRARAPRHPAACTIAGFYRYRRRGRTPRPLTRRARPPSRLDYESHATALGRHELGALLVASGLGPPAEYALISLLALSGLRVSEAAGADIEHLSLERGHRTLEWPVSYFMASRSSRQACSQRRQASAQTRQCSCIRACRSHSSPQLLQMAMPG